MAQSATLSRILYKYSIPQSVDAAVVPLQFVDDVQVLHPLSVAVDAPYVCVFLAMVPNLPLQEAVIDCVLHLELVAVRTKVVVAGKGAGEGWSRQTRQRRLLQSASEERLSQGGLFEQSTGSYEQDRHASRRVQKRCSWDLQSVACIEVRAT
jgi:hypothetical protein